MSDSEIKTKEQPGKTPVVSEEIVKKPTGELVKVVRGAGGKFVKQKKTMPKTVDVTRLLRNLLNSPEAGLDGKLSKGAESRMRRMFDNIFNIASTSPHQPVLDKFGNPVRDSVGRIITVMDAKVAMASVQAFKELMLRAHGVPPKNEEEVEALKTQGVKIIILQHPELMDKNVYSEKPKEVLVPAFIEGEFVENPKA